MTTIEIKKTIIDKIAQIEDLHFLKAIKIIIESRPNESVFKVTDEMRSKIEHSRNVAKQGKIVSDKEVNREIEEWLRQGK